MAEHRAAHLKISGAGLPEVTKLQNGRKRLEFRCVGVSKEDWYSDRIEGRLFADFGSLMNAEMKIDGLGGSTNIPERDYADMRLRENRLEYTPSGALVVFFAYETLTDEFVQVKDDNIDYELNGLRRVTRPLIAKAGVEYTKVVGDSYIDHSVNSEATTKLYLASFKVDDDDAARMVEEVWLEAGTLSVSEENTQPGVKRVSTTFLAVEGSTTGPVLSRSTGDFEGLKTITVTTMQDASGSALGSAAVSYTPVHTGENFVNFTYPGTVEIVGTELRPYIASTQSQIVAYQFKVTPQAPATVLATTYTYYQTNGTIKTDTNGDYVNGGASGPHAGADPDGYWNPTEWAEGISKGIGVSFQPYARSIAFNKCRAISSTEVDPHDDNDPTLIGLSVSGTVSTSGVPESEIVINDGVRGYGGAYYEMTIGGGPPAPDANKYVLDIDISPAFTDVDDVEYYRKTITVATIPTQGDNILSP